MQSGDIGTLAPDGIRATLINEFVFGAHDAPAL